MPGLWHQFQFHHLAVLAHDLDLHLAWLVPGSRSRHHVLAHAHAHRSRQRRLACLVAVDHDQCTLGQTADLQGRDAGLLARNLLLNLSAPGWLDRLAAFVQIALQSRHGLHRLGERDVRLAQVVQNRVMGRKLVAALELDDRLGRLPVLVQLLGPVEVLLCLGPGAGRRVSTSRDRSRRNRKHCQTKNDSLQQTCHFTTLLLHSPCPIFV